MKLTNHTNNNYKLKQLKLPLEIEKIIEISDSVYSFGEIVDCIDLNSYFVKKGYKYEQHVRGNNYGRTEEIYECEDCENCSHKQKCCPKAKNNRTRKLNRELTSIHGALLCMNRSIQAEGTFGIIKCDKSYKRLRRKGLNNVQLEILLVACGYNLYKYHNKINRLSKCA